MKIGKKVIDFTLKDFSEIVYENVCDTMVGDSVVRMLDAIRYARLMCVVPEINAIMLCSGGPYVSCYDLESWYELFMVSSLDDAVTAMQQLADRDGEELLEMYGG